MRRVRRIRPRHATILFASALALVTIACEDAPTPTAVSQPTALDATLPYGDSAPRETRAAYLETREARSGLATTTWRTTETPRPSRTPSPTLRSVLEPSRRFTVTMTLEEAIAEIESWSIPGVENRVERAFYADREHYQQVVGGWIQQGESEVLLLAEVAQRPMRIENQVGPGVMRRETPGARSGAAPLPRGVRCDGRHQGQRSVQPFGR